jgi:hypothetical protein
VQLCSAAASQAPAGRAADCASANGGGAEAARSPASAGTEGRAGEPWRWRAAGTVSPVMAGEGQGLGAAAQAVERCRAQD